MMPIRASLLLLIPLLTVACDKEQAAPAAAPAAKMSHPVPEAELNTITLSEDTEKRLGITVVPIERKTVPGGRVLAGEVVVPPGGTIEVTAPMAGVLVASGGVIIPGRVVRQGEPLYRIVPLLAGDRDLRINAERDLATARAAHQASQQRAARAETLLADGAGSRRSSEEARADLATAQATLQAAEERVQIVNRGHVSQSNEMIVPAPISGVIELVQAQPGQTVPAAALLARIARLDRLWVKVPVYAGDARNIDADQGATVMRLGEPSGAPGLHARRIGAPPSATAEAAAINLMFELPGDFTLNPGERVSVRLVERGTETATVVPYSALLHDIHGGTWVYARTAPHAFARQRVEVRDVVNDLVILNRGPALNTPVVTTGAAELYGVEFGVGK